jgi:hypothetical protein
VPLGTRSGIEQRLAVDGHPVDEPVLAQPLVGEPVVTELSDTADVAGEARSARV